jgi:hypothetical protein
MCTAPRLPKIRVAKKRWRALALACTFAAPACVNIPLEPVGHKGSTLPTPDMSKLQFTGTQDGLSLLAIGQPEAMWPSGEVRFANRRTRTVDGALAASDGSFLVVLTDAKSGDAIIVTTGDAGTKAPSTWTHNTSSSQTVEVQASPATNTPPAPTGVSVSWNDSGTAPKISGLFAATTAAVTAVARRLNDGQSFSAAALPGENDTYTFDIAVSAQPGDEFALWGQFNASDPAPSPGPAVFVTIPNR